MTKEKKIIRSISIALVLLYSIILIGWYVLPQKEELAIQAPGADNRPKGLARSANDVKIGEFFMKYKDAEASTLTGKWTGFRGANQTNIVTTNDKIDQTSQKFNEIWSVETGEGHAASVIYNGKVYFLDYDEKLSSDALRCFSLETGKELWRRWYRVPIKRNHGFSRTIPAIGDGFIITIGPNGHVMCCDPATGDLKWTLDLQKTYGTEIPFWYAGQCPLVDGNTLVLAPAGKDILMTGLDCVTGKVLWTTPNKTGYKMSHSSIIPMNFNGTKTYVYAGIGGVCGISAEESSKGQFLWETDDWQPSVIAPSPVQVDGNRFFIVAGYGAGGAMFTIKNSAGSWSAKVMEQYKANEGIAGEQQSPIYYKNMLISIMPKDGGSLRGKLVCFSPTNLHKELWSSSGDDRFGLGPFMVINNLVFALKEDGELLVYKVLNDKMELIKKQKLMEGVDAWGPMAYADGYLVLRDAHRVKCFKIGTHE